jgi:hypothetical protein
MPLRSVELTEAVGATAVSGAADVQALLAILRSPKNRARPITTRLIVQAACGPPPAAA